LPREQTAFEPLELGFLRGAKWRRRSRSHFEPRFGAEPGRHPHFIFVHVFSFRLVWVKKAKNPRLTGNRGFLKNILLNQNFTPTTPKRRQTRVQMDMRPLVCACFSVGANVLFIFNRQEETPLGRICQKFFISKAVFSGLVGWRSGAKLVQA
jgi:hypothetical protein